MDASGEAAANLVVRAVSSGERAGAATRTMRALRVYPTDPTDLWEALTDPKRIARWFLPVTGDLVIGGRYQLEGNAGGTIEHCVPPESFALTWEYGDSVSWLTVTLVPAPNGTTLELSYESPLDPAFWEDYGPGATGLGWDAAILFLGRHLETGESFAPEDEGAFWTSAEGALFARSVAGSWADAAIAAGDSVDQARAAMERSIAFFTGNSEDRS